MIRIGCTDRVTFDNNDDRSKAYVAPDGNCFMRHALERLTELIETISHQDYIMNDKNVDLREAYISISQKETRQIKTYLLRKSANIQSERSFELLIQRYQKEVVRLMDDLFHDKFRKLLRQKVIVHEALLKDLDEILSHIEDRYHKYFNLDERVPGVHLIVSQNDLKERIKDVKARLEKKIDGSLLKMVYDSLHAFIRQDANVSYRQLIYMKELVKELDDLSTPGLKATPASGGQSPETQWTQRLIASLVYMNFNSSLVVDYLIGEIVDTVNAIHDQHEKVERIAQFYKEYNQMQVKPGFALRPQCWSIKEQVSCWLTEEMDYVQQKQRLLSVVPVMKDDYIFPDEEKMHFSTSADVLSLFMRACMDTKFVLNKQKTPMLKVAAKFMRTIEQENLSYKSMRNNWYQVEAGQKEKLKSILMEMYKKVHGY